MANNNDDAEKIMVLTRIMGLKIAQLSPDAKVQAQLEKFSLITQEYQKTINEYEKQVKEYSSLHQKVTKLEKEVIEYRNKFDPQAKATIEKLEAEKFEVEKQLKITLNEFSELKDHLTTQKNIVNNLSIENQKIQNQLKGQWNANQNLRKTLKNERETIEQLNDRIKELKLTLRRLQRRLARGGTLFGIHIPVEKIEDTEIQDIDKNVKEQLEQMKFELSKRLDKITELEMKNRELKNQIIKSPTRDLQLQIQTLRKDVDVKKGKIATFETERNKLEKEIGILQIRITDLQVSYQEQSKMINNREKKIADLEKTMRLGIHEKNARDLIINLQENNKKLQEEIRFKDREIRNLDKNAFFYKQQLDVVKGQVQELYAKNRELITRLKEGSSVSVREIVKEVDYFEGTTEIDKEMKDQAYKLQRLKEMNKNLEQEISDLRFALHSKDTKIEELNQIMSELKATLADAKIQIDVTKKKKKS